MTEKKSTILVRRLGMEIKYTSVSTYGKIELECSRNLVDLIDDISVSEGVSHRYAFALLLAYGYSDFSRISHEIKKEKEAEELKAGVTDG